MTILKRLCAIRGVYVPALYDVQYNADGTIRVHEAELPRSARKGLKGDYP